MTQGTLEQEHKSKDVAARAKLIRMLQSMLRKFPSARLMLTAGGFGVYLDAETALYIASRGQWTDEAIRDWLALFATWLVADPAAIRSGGTTLRGFLQMAAEEPKR
jgi:tryptophanase